MSWQLQEAKNKLSLVVQEANSTGPQIITVRGKETAVVLSFESYQKLLGHTGSLVDFLRASPWSDEEIPIVRSKDLGRTIDL
jgi:prevent-host-death family protein